MAQVIWQRLILRGFGCYRDEVDIELDADSQVLASPNETGKSTLVAGLAAVLFGLPAISDASKFGQARYRNWDDPQRCEGELYFSVAGDEYHLSRQFETHQVRLRQRQGEQWVDMPQATGIDNPNATRPLQSYRDTLHSLLGISSLDLFLSTFCLAQPLPTPAGLDAEVQGLLSGAGGMALEVQEDLAEQVRQRTRYYAQPLERSRNGNKDRQLELVQNEMAVLQERIETGQQSAADLQVIRERLLELDEQLEKQAELLQKRSQTLQAWTAWRTYEERYRHQLEQQGRVEESLSEAERWQEQQAATQQELGEYADFAASQVAWEEHLEQMAQWQRDLLRLQSEKEQAGQELAELLQEEEQLTQELQQFPMSFTQATLLADHARWLEAQDQLHELQTAIDKLQSEIESVEQRQAQLPDFSVLGPYPSNQLAEYQRLVAEKQAIYDRWQSKRRQLQNLEQDQKQRYQLLQQAPESVYTDLADYQRRAWELEKNVQEAQRQERTIVTRETDYQKALAEYEQHCGELTAPPDEMLQAVNRHLHTAGTRRPQQKAQQAWFSRLAGLAGALLLYLLWGKQAGGLGIVVSLACVALGWLWPYWQQRSVPVAQEATVLGPLADLSFDDLLTARSLLEQLLQSWQNRPAAEEIAAAQQASRDAQAEQAGWLQRLAPYREAYDDPQAAYDDWQQLGDAIDYCRQELDHLIDSLGVDPLASAVGEQLVAALNLQPLLDLMQLQPDSLTALLEQLDPEASCWSDWQADAQAFANLDKQAGRLRAELGYRQARSADSNQTEAERLEQEIAALREQLGSHVCQLDKDELQEQYEKYQALQQRKLRLEAASDRLRERLVAMDSDLEKLAADLSQAAEAIQPAWAAAGGDLAAVRRRYQKYKQLLQQLDEIKKAQQAIWRLHQVKDMAGLRGEKIEKQNAVVATRLQWEDLIKQNPGLPHIDMRQPAEIEQWYRELQAEVAQLETELTQLRQEEQNLLRRRAQLEGQEPCNIAVATERLQELRRTEEQLRLQVDAYGLAYRTLVAAQTEYGASHRQRLAQQASSYFQRITGEDGRSVELDEDFGVAVRTANGLISPAQLSKGARDQLYISLRLAIADLLAQDVRLPLILDDPFVNCDAERLQRMAKPCGK